MRLVATLAATRRHLILLVLLVTGLFGGFMRRRRVSNRGFHRTAKAVHPVNNMSPMRGGIRL